LRNQGAVLYDGPGPEGRITMNRGHALAAFALLAAAALALPAASRAQDHLNVIVSGGFTPPYRAMIAQFQTNSGVRVSTTGGASQGDGPNTIGAQLARGVPADVIILSKEGLEDIMAAGRIVPGSNVDLAQTPVGISVYAGSPKPDVSTVDAFRKAMLNARSVTFPASTVGIYLTTKLFPQLGIADQMTPKITNAGVAAVGKGQAEIAVQAVSELLNVPGTDYVGLIPKEIQYISVFSAAIVSNTQNADAARRLIAFYASDQATAAIKAAGMERLPAH
jgi:molybdate transport system substrate-binding protein